MLMFSSAAGNATLSLSPSSGSHSINSNFTLVVYENSGNEEVNTVDVKLSYDQSKLRLTSVSVSGSPFNNCIESSGGGGQISIVCAKLGGLVTGNQPVGQLTFAAVAGSGSTSLNFNSDSHIYRSSDSSDIWNGNTSAGSYTFTTPSASVPAPTPASPPPSGTSSPNVSSPPQSSTSNTANPRSSSPNPSVPSSSQAGSVDSSQPVPSLANGKPLAQSVQNKDEAAIGKLNTKSNPIALIAGSLLVSLAIGILGYLGRYRVLALFNKSQGNTNYMYKDYSEPSIVTSVSPVSEGLKNVSSPVVPSPGSSFAPESKGPDKPTISQD